VRAAKRVAGLRAAALEEWHMLKAGDVAPDFTVRDHTGRTHRLSDYRGKTVVLWFYPKADTPG
jgi:peroxiredoxin Q/BCP